MSEKQKAAECSRAATDSSTTSAEVAAEKWATNWETGDSIRTTLLRDRTQIRIEAFLAGVAWAVRSAKPSDIAMSSKDIACERRERKCP
jgi:hypothetical protein